MQEQLISKKELFNKKQAAQILNCSEITIHRQIKANHLGHFRIGKKVLIGREHIEQFLARCARPAAAA